MDDCSGLDWNPVDVGQPHSQLAAVVAGFLFAGFWLEAPQSALIERVQQRRHDPSDADVDVVLLQSAQPIDPANWTRVDASRPSIAVREEVESALEDPDEIRPSSSAWGDPDRFRSLEPRAGGKNVD